MTRFASYEQALKAAQDMANVSKLDVAIRRQVEFGKDGYNVSFACRNDSDYALAEIVKPSRTFPTEHDTSSGTGFPLGV